MSVPHGKLKKMFEAERVQAHVCAAFLLPKDLLYLAHFFLNFAFYLLFFAFHFKVGILAEFPRNFLNSAFLFVDIAFYLVLRTAFHSLPPFKCRFSILQRNYSYGFIKPNNSLPVLPAVKPATRYCL